jgi:enoyl-CoA hydratase/carnithine racemase
MPVRSMLECLVGMETRSLEQSLRDERRAVHLTSGTPDAKEGSRAFLEKRKPHLNKS